MPTSSVLSKITGYTGLYALYVYLAGWTFFDFYFRSFGLDPRWLNIGVTETFVKGFTAMFTFAGLPLLAIYAVVICAPVALEMSARLERRMPWQAGVIILLLLMLFFTYDAAKRSGLAAAGQSGGVNSDLPAVTFVVEGEQYSGRLLATGESFLYFHDVHALSGGDDAAYAGQLQAFAKEQVKSMSLEERVGP